MYIYANNDAIAKKGKWGRRLSMIGLLILGLGMLLSLAPSTIQKWIDTGNSLAQIPFVLWVYRVGWVYLSMAVLIFGFILGQVGNSMMRRFLRPNRPDIVIAKALKGFDNRNRLYVWASPIDLAFVGPAGIYAIVGRDHPGEIMIQGYEAKTPFSFRKILFFFGDEGMGRPLVEAEADAEKLQSWLQEQLGTDTDIQVQPLVLFTNDRAQLQVQDPAVPVVHYKQLKSYLRSQAKRKPIAKSVLQQVTEILDAYAASQGARPVQEQETSGK